MHAHEAAQIRTVPGPHPGWTDHYFHHRGWDWRLLTINDEVPRSMLKPEDKLNAPKPPAVLAYFQPFQGLLTVATARQIISLIMEAHEVGVRDGRKQKMDELRKALGL